MEPITFGTDGVRGLANDELTPEIALALGHAAARTLGAATVLVGRDTRRSSSMLSAAVCAGAASQGADVVDLGVLPTPGVAALCARRRVPGLVVSASHNPFYDNGVKVLASGGVKLRADVEAAIEAELATALRAAPARPRPTGRRVGEVRSDPGAREEYASLLVDAARGASLRGLFVVVDCANGAASGIAPDVLRALGATVVSIGNEPDGCNINEQVGSTSPEALATAVVTHGADLGFAVDGDADRCIAVDSTGRVLDGDWLLALFATDAKREGTLGGGVVVTTMANLGLHRTMRAAGIEVVEVPVGDRYVSEALERTGWRLGGEQSGHIIFADLATTGDGTLTGIMLAALVKARGPLAGLTSGLIVPVPQLLVNVAVADASSLEEATEVWDAVEQHRAALGDAGRVVLRASGTEPLVRVMVEAADEHDAQRVAEALRRTVTEALGSPGGQG